MINLVEKETTDKNEKENAKSAETSNGTSQFFHIDPDSAIRSRHEPKYHVKLTTGARKIIDEEQAKMLINMIAHEFEKRPELNIFRFEKVGLIVLKNGFNILILTETEKNSMSSS